MLLCANCPPCSYSGAHCKISVECDTPSFVHALGHPSPCIALLHGQYRQDCKQHLSLTESIVVLMGADGC